MEWLQENPIMYNNGMKEYKQGKEDCYIDRIYCSIGCTWYVKCWENVTVVTPD